MINIGKFSTLLIKGRISRVRGVRMNMIDKSLIQALQKRPKSLRKTQTNMTTLQKMTIINTKFLQTKIHLKNTKSILQIIKAQITEQT